MDKGRLTRMLDILFALAMFQLVFANFGIPYPRTFEGFWRLHSEVFRAGASLLWLLGLWLGGYRAWDRAAKVTHGTVLAGAGLILCVLLTPYLTQLIIISYIALVSQLLYGGCMLLAVLFRWLMFRSLMKANANDAECVQAASAHGRVLFGAAGILAVGMVITIVRFRQAMWYSVSVSALYLLAMAAVRRREA